jgi:hypothetical protein
MRSSGDRVFASPRPRTRMGAATARRHGPLLVRLFRQQRMLDHWRMVGAEKFPHACAPCGRSLLVSDPGVHLASLYPEIKLSAVDDVIVRAIAKVGSGRLCASLVAPNIAPTEIGIGPTSMEDRIAQAGAAQASIRQPSSESANENRRLVTMRPDPRNESGGGNLRLRTMHAECGMNARPTQTRTPF